MKLTKHVTFILTLAICLFILVSCVNNNGTPSESPDGSPTDPSTEKPTEPNSNTPQDSLSKYSKLLQDVLTSEEYNNLIIYAHNSNPKILETGEFEPHPYAFLEDEGFDVEAIKKGNDLCHTISYTIADDPTSLYMYTRVDCGEYYENFLLRYELTEQEMKDYNLTHTGDGNVLYYVQSVFMNREIAKTRDPEVVGTSKMSKTSFESLTESMNLTRLVETNQCNIIMINPNPEDYTFQLILLPQNTNQYGPKCNSKIVELSFRGYVKLDNNGVFFAPNTYPELTPVSKDDLKATLFFTNEAEFKHLDKSNLNNNLN